MSEDATKGWKVYHRRGGKVIYTIPLWVFADEVIRSRAIKPSISVEGYPGGKCISETYSMRVDVVRKIWTPDPGRRVSASIEVYVDVYDLNQSQSQGGSSSSRGDAV